MDVNGGVLEVSAFDGLLDSSALQEKARDVPTIDRSQPQIPLISFLSYRIGPNCG
jgi:hypothetical protein